MVTITTPGSRPPISSALAVRKDDLRAITRQARRGSEAPSNYRLRLLLHCGVTWQTHRMARLRGRNPRFVA
jgi:hypothetical protein